MSTPAAVAPRPRERHRSERIGWLRAAVLGANDGIVSTASLVIGIAAAQSSRQQVLVAGVAGLVAGAMSMAAGEYVSVSSQSDTERADLAIESAELAADPDIERDELADIYVTRGLDITLARQVADQLMAHDALGAHARDELGLSEITTARPRLRRSVPRGRSTIHPFFAKPSAAPMGPADSARWRRMISAMTSIFPR